MYCLSVPDMFAARCWLANEMPGSITVVAARRRNHTRRRSHCTHESHAVKQYQGVPPAGARLFTFILVYQKTIMLVVVFPISGADR